MARTPDGLARVETHHVTAIGLEVTTKDHWHVAGRTRTGVGTQNARAGEPPDPALHLSSYDRGQDALLAKLASLSGDEFQFVPASQGLAACDVAIISAHGENIKDAVWSARQTAPDTLFALWLWDNHLAYVENLQSALAVDFVFPSHLYKAPYLANPAAALATHVPACSAQWTRSEAAQIFASDGHGRAVSGCEIAR
jgi:hypothetical protein